MKLIYSNGINVNLQNLTEASPEIRQDIESFIRNDLYRTPLHQCVYDGDLERMKRLVLEEKFDINQMPSMLVLTNKEANSKSPSLMPCSSYRERDLNPGLIQLIGIET